MNIGFNSAMALKNYAMQHEIPMRKNLSQPQIGFKGVAASMDDMVDRDDVDDTPPISLKTKLLAGAALLAAALSVCAPMIRTAQYGNGGDLPETQAVELLKDFSAIPGAQFVQKKGEGFEYLAPIPDAQGREAIPFNRKSTGELVRAREKQIITVTYNKDPETKEVTGGKVIAKVWNPETKQFMLRYGLISNPLELCEQYKALNEQQKNQ